MQDLRNTERLDERMLTVQEAAQLLGLSRGSGRHRLTRGLMRGQSLAGRIWLIPTSEVERWQSAGLLSKGLEAACLSRDGR